MRADARFEHGPSGETVFAGDDQLGVAQLQMSNRRRILRGVFELRVTAPDAVQCIPTVALAGFEKLSGFSPGNVEMGVLRQTPLDGRHNLPSLMRPRVRTLRAGSQVEFRSNRATGGLSPFPRTGCFRQAPPESAIRPVYATGNCIRLLCGERN